MEPNNGICESKTMHSCLGSHTNTHSCTPTFTHTHTVENTPGKKKLRKLNVKLKGSFSLETNMHFLMAFVKNLLCFWKKTRIFLIFNFVGTSNIDVLECS